MPGPDVTPIVSDHTLPKAVDVTVIGGGIVGVSTALELAERGVSVLLCEKGQIGAEQSSRNWGWVRISRRDPREIPLMIAAVDRWSRIGTRTGRDTGYRQTGILFNVKTETRYAQYERWAENLRPHEIECRMISGAELDRRMPGHRIESKGALFTPIDGRAEPQLATPAMAEAARESGASIMTGCAVRSLDIAAGRVAGVVTERGRVACDAVVLAGGAWSRLFAGNAGIDLPQLKVMGSVLRTTPVQDGPDIPIWTDRFALRKRLDGGYSVAVGGRNIVDIVPDSFRLARRFLPALASEWRMLQFRLSGRWREEAREARRWRPDEITPFELTRVLDPTPSVATLRRGWAAVRDAFPALQGADIVQSWAGMIDVTPDALPVISGVDDLSGLHIATGFSGHGFGIGPGAGQLMADLVTGTTPVVDPTDFRLSRFTDGSRIGSSTGY